MSFKTPKYKIYKINYIWSILYEIKYILNTKRPAISQIYLNLIKISNFLTKQSWETASNVVLKRYKDDVDTGTGFKPAACTVNVAVYIDFGDKYNNRDVGRPLTLVTIRRCLTIMGIFDAY